MLAMAAHADSCTRARGVLWLFRCRSESPSPIPGPWRFLSLGSRYHFVQPPAFVGDTEAPADYAVPIAG